MENSADQTQTKSTRTLPFGRLFTWQMARRTLMGLAGLATLIAIFYTVENWRGKRAWEKCKRELEAKGAVLAWNAYIPPACQRTKIFSTHQKWRIGLSAPLTGRPANQHKRIKATARSIQHEHDFGNLRLKGQREIIWRGVTNPNPISTPSAKH